MRKHRSSLFPMLVVGILTVAPLFAQPRLTGDLDLNHLRGVVNNRGLVSELRWLSADSQMVAFAFGLLVGGEVIDANGDTVHIVSDGFGFGTGGDYEPGTTNSWGFEPLSGWANPALGSIARSDDPYTWPSGWSAWPATDSSGFPVADLEFLWAMNDSTNAEFAYYPVANNSAIRGLGLEVVGRTLQWRAPLFEDILLLTFEIRNVGNRRLERLVAGMFGDPNLGGPNDFIDDRVDYDTGRDLFYAYDDAGPYLGWVTLDGPGGGMTSYASLLFGGNNEPRNDALMWSLLTPGTELVDTTATDHVMLFGSGYFGLDPGESVRYAVGMAMGTDLSDLRRNIDQVRNLFTLVGVDGEPAPALAPGGFSLYPNHPNPFNPSTRVAFEVGSTEWVTLRIHDVLGRPVATLVDGWRSAGRHEVVWDGRDRAGRPVASGVYLYRLTAGGQSAVRKMVLMK